MPFTVGDIAGWVGGTVSGPADTPILRATALTDAGPGDLTLVDGPKRRKEWEASKATAAVVPADYPDDPRPLVRVTDPLAAFIQIVMKVRGERPSETGIHPTAVVHPTAKLGANPFVGPYAVIGEGSTVGANARIHPGVVVGRFCTLGDDVTLHPKVVVYDDCTLGSRVIIHAGAVIGADGFGYRLVKGRHEKVPQLGTVVVEDDVEIGANTTIDRGTFGATRIGAGTKIDNQVMVSHNCKIGKHNIFVSQVGMAGSSVTGDYVVIAGQVGIADHVTIGDKAVVGAQAGVMKDIPPGTYHMGYPSMPGREFMKVVAEWGRLAEVRRDVARVKKHLKLDEETSG